LSIASILPWEVRHATINMQKMNCVYMEGGYTSEISSLYSMPELFF
jgi:hypothetical protein